MLWLAMRGRPQTQDLPLGMGLLHIAKIILLIILELHGGSP
jgi:hypothetical protein